MVPFEVLSAAPFFDELSDDKLKRVCALGEMKAYPEGVLLDQRRRKAKHFYLILEGEIGLEVESVTGKTIRLETIGQGGAIGFSSLIETGSARYYSSDAKTLTPVKAIRFSADGMMILFYQDFELGFLVMKKIAYIAKKRLEYRTYPIPKIK